MRRGLISRLCAAILSCLIVIGGGGMPVLDGVLFHTRDRAGDALRPHFEASSGCHSDGCAVRTTAHQPRSAAAAAATAQITAAPSRAELPPVLPEPLARSSTGQPLSRAPPFFA